MASTVKREIQILKMFRHPHITKLYEVIYTATDVFMIMEYVSGGELFDYIVTHGKLAESKARLFFQQIISAVDYCHRHMVVHRDLKPENLLLDEHDNVKVADFGLSNIMKDGDFLSTSCGSPNYAAPEVISGKLYAGPEVDVWSAGVILYALLCGRLPFDDDYIPNLFKKIKGGIYTLPTHLSEGARDLIQTMLVVDPLQRTTIDDVRMHPWFMEDLPPYLAVNPTQFNVNIIDEHVLAEVCSRLEVSVLEARAAIRSPDEGSQHILVAYRLMLDSKAILSAALTSRDEQIPDTMLATSPPAWDFKEDTAERPGARSAGHQAHAPMYAKYVLGLRSGAPPTDIMIAVCAALRALGLEWKAHTAFSLRVRFPPLPGAAPTDCPLKMVLTLYELDPRLHALDFRRLAGDLFVFLETTRALLIALEPIRLAGDRQPRPGTGGIGAAAASPYAASPYAASI
eukprot:c16447_g1_i3.p1 GENE.c16447_g1_i3~~c16447_g1_i3.p1  ORF type:complete len:457 (+),score=82.54 c16447_g1_i3:257-1627(+)